MLEQIIEFSINNPMLVSAFVLLLALIAFNESRTAGGSVGVAEAVRLMNREEAITLDIRDRKNFAQGHIAGSINIPTANLDSRIQELDKHKEKKILVVCNTGSSTGIAIAKLQKAGFEQALRLKGGIMQWQSDSMPVVKK
ncbi:rhodanese-like domain-containing protein [Marinospirillum insulare]|uniref:Rhodanese-like domain-containing protein n=1 Tax=Marinospirillum insulare TaxID=217169 RepID=A0ABQ6A438_9GAMM|nr:rhodanese-like domain-containing protein [Marinospirillum insulare]GLR64874.1 rhodanese-like domain-containing protein [Marinospirillum insulare]